MTPQTRKQVKVSLPQTQAEELERRARMGQPVSSQLEHGTQLLLDHFDGQPNRLDAWDRLPSLAKYHKEGKRTLRVYLPVKLVDRLGDLAINFRLGYTPAARKYLWPHAVELLLKSEEGQK